MPNWTGATRMMRTFVSFFFMEEAHAEVVYGPGIEARAEARKKRGLKRFNFIESRCTPSIPPRSSFPGVHPSSYFFCGAICRRRYLGAERHRRGYLDGESHLFALQISTRTRRAPPFLHLDKITTVGICTLEPSRRG